MLNEFQFSFSGKDVEKLIAGGCERVIVTGKVVYDSASGKSVFEIYAENSSDSTQSRSAAAAGGKIIGCPMPC